MTNYRTFNFVDATANGGRETIVSNYWKVNSLLIYLPSDIDMNYHDYNHSFIELSN